MQTLLNKFFILVICIIFIQNIKAESISKLSVIKLDSDHHDMCSQKVKDKNDLESYWTCRINLMQKYITTNKRNKSFSEDYMHALQTVYKIVTYRKEQCLDKIYRQKFGSRYTQTVFLNDTDAYYFDLIKERFSTDILYANQVYTKQQEEEDLKKTRLMSRVKKEANCYHLRENSIKYTKCLELQEAKETCFEEIEKKLKDTEMQHKFECKKQAIETYPDNLVLYNREFERLNNLQHDQYIIDRDLTQKTENRKKELSNLISGPKLSKQQLINLRKDVEIQCNIDKQKILEDLSFNLNKECEELE